MSLIDLPAPPQEAGRHPVSALVRLRVLVGWRALDRQLADGRCPASDPRLARRAARLGRPAERAGLAASLRDAVRSLDETALTLRRRPQVPVDAAAVGACAPEIGELARALTAPETRIRGVAIVSALLTDGLGPLYAGPADPLRNTLRTARAAL
jgi:hypothetical protein